MAGNTVDKTHVAMMDLLSDNVLMEAVDVTTSLERMICVLPPS